MTQNIIDIIALIVSILSLLLAVLTPIIVASVFLIRHVVRLESCHCFELETNIQPEIIKKD